MAIGSSGRRLAVPLLLALTVVAVVPFMGLLRDFLVGLLPRAFAPVLTVLFASTLAAAAVFAWRHIRTRRLLRLGGCALAGALVALQVTGFAQERADVSAVERVHILEYGLLALLFYWALRPAAGAVAVPLAGLVAAIVGILDETVQWLLASRVGEMRDILLNWAAAGSGLVGAVALWPPGRRAAPGGGAPGSGNRRPWPALGLLAATWVLLSASFFDFAHLGHRIEDREGGLVLRSWVDGDRLRELSADRQRRWARQPPGRRGPLALEDYYMTAGVGHVQARNQALAEGREGDAWGEQRILERWYAPLLEIRGRSSGRPFDLPPWKRERLRAQALARAQSAVYESPALAGRVFLRPSRATLWSVASLLAIVGLALAFAPRRSPASPSELP